MFNLPTIDVNNFAVGAGILFLGPTGATPTIDVGANRAGAVVSISRTKEKVMAGSPLHIVDSIATQEEVTLTVTAMEWNLSNLSRAIGDGVTTSTGTTENLEMGGTNDFDKLAVMYRHRTKAGHTIFIKLWEATGNGNVDINFSEGVHEFPFTFEAHDATSDWAGDSTGESRRLFEIERQKQ
jgi:hypothetical protein